METITTEQLREMKDKQQDLALVDVLGPDSFRQFHLPGAINVPVGEDFEEEIQKAVPDKDKPVVVYCSDEECPASRKAARVMDRLGYEKVYDYDGGKKAWQEAGLSVVAGASSG
jgi:rhodanese-related sulfurtransferase